MHFRPYASTGAQRLDDAFFTAGISGWKRFAVIIINTKSERSWVRIPPRTKNFSLRRVAPHFLSKANAHKEILALISSTLNYLIVNSLLSSLEEEGSSKSRVTSKQLRVGDPWHGPFQKLADSVFMVTYLNSFPQILGSYKLVLSISAPLFPEYDFPDRGQTVGVYHFAHETVHASQRESSSLNSWFC